MNIYRLLTDKLLISNDNVKSSYDKCVFCCLIYCCLPVLELSESNNESYKKKKFSDNNLVEEFEMIRDTNPMFSKDDYMNEYPENFFHLNSK